MALPPPSVDDRREGSGDKMLHQYEGWVWKLPKGGPSPRLRRDSGAALLVHSCCPTTHLCRDAVLLISPTILASFASTPTLCMKTCLIILKNSKHSMQLVRDSPLSKGADLVAIQDVCSLENLDPLARLQSQQNESLSILPLAFSLSQDPPHPSQAALTVLRDYANCGSAAFGGIQVRHPNL